MEGIGIEIYLQVTFFIPLYMQLTKTLTAKEFLKHAATTGAIFLLVLIIGGYATYKTITLDTSHNKSTPPATVEPVSSGENTDIIDPTDPINTTTTSTADTVKIGDNTVTLLNKNNNTIIIKNTATSTGSSTSGSGKATSTTSSNTSTTQQVKVPAGMTLQSYLDHIALSQAMISTGGDPTKQAQVIANATATAQAPQNNEAAAMTLCKEIASYMGKDLGSITSGVGCLAMVKSDMLYTLNGVHSQEQATKYNYFINKIKALGY